MHTASTLRTLENMTYRLSALRKHTYTHTHTHTRARMHARMQAHTTPPAPTTPTHTHTQHKTRAEERSLGEIDWRMVVGTGSTTLLNKHRNFFFIERGKCTVCVCARVCVCVCVCEDTTVGERRGTNKT